MSKIGIIIGSARPNRFGPHVANWIFGLAHEHGGAEFEIVDIEEYNLPLLDEPEPAPTPYTKKHTKEWSAKIAEFDGYVIVTPEYNHSMPASLKNAFDFLYDEWKYKPVAYVSYGVVGGARVVEQLRTIAAQFSQYDLRTQVMIIEPKNYLDEKEKFQPSSRHQKNAQKLIKEIVFWADEFKPLRAKLAAG